MNTLDEVVDEAAHRYAVKCWWASLDDLKQEAWTAVLHAQRTWDPARGVTLPWYAWRAAVYALRTYTWRAGAPVYAPIKKLQELKGVSRVEVDVGLPAQAAGVDESLHDARMAVEVAHHLYAACHRGRYAEGVVRVLLGGERPSVVAASLGVPVGRLWRATARIKKRLRKDPTLARLMRRV